MNEQKQTSSLIESSYLVSNPLSEKNSKDLNIADQMLNNITIFQEKKLHKLITRLEHHIYGKFFEKIIKDHLPKNLIQKKVYTSSQQFNKDEYYTEMTRRIKAEVDSLQSWIKLNLIEKKQIIQFKKKMLQRAERKAKKQKQIFQLIQKIAEKKKQRKIEEIISTFADKRRENYEKFVPNQNIEKQNQLAKRRTQKNPDQSVLQFQNAKKILDEYKRRTQDQTGICLVKLEKLLL